MESQLLQKWWPGWQIEGEPLGKGSFGVVYRAVHREHGAESRAAIKVISIDANSSNLYSMGAEGLSLEARKTYLDKVKSSFIDEIKIMQGMKGVQNIVSIDDFQVQEKSGGMGWDIYIRMELLTPFTQHILEKKMTEADIIKLGCDICTALEICAKKEIIHRDIKPENIFVNDFGHFKLGDFGIARKMEDLTDGLSQKGTFYYVAPEVTKSRLYDARVDIYSLGLVLYFLCNNNRLPFLESGSQIVDLEERKKAVDRRLDGEKLPAPSQASEELSAVILQACAADPNDRFSSATKMKQALEQAAHAISAKFNEKETLHTSTDDGDRLGRTTSVNRPPDPPPPPLPEKTYSMIPPN